MKNPLYKELVKMRAPDVIRYMQEGWSVAFACRSAGLDWQHAREHLITNEEFVRVLKEVRAKQARKLGMI